MKLQDRVDEEVSGGRLTYLRTNQATKHLLSTTNSLVPASLLAVRVVLGYSAAAGGRVAHAGDSRMRSVVLNLSLVLLGLAFSLVCVAASDRAEDVLCGAADGVDVGLEGGGVLVRHSGL
jgi:hypothetical protein